MPLAPNPLESALLSGSLPAVLDVLHEHKITTQNGLPKAQHERQTAATSRVHAALKKLHRTVLSVSLLSQSVASPSPLLPILASLRANLALLPSLGLPTHPLGPSLSQCPPDDLDTASTGLAQTASVHVDTLVDQWNHVIPSAHLVEQPDQLPQMLESLRSQTRLSISRIDSLRAQLRDIQRTTITLLHIALRVAVSSVEQDAAEYSSPTPALPEHVSMLLHRNLAVSRKLHLVGAQVSAMVYTPQTVAALSRIADAVDHRAGVLHRRLSHARALLSTYQGLGIDYVVTVETIASLRSKLDQLQWSLKELDWNGKRA